MKKITPTTWYILLAVLALLALLVLAASLNTLQFREGKPLPMGRVAPDLLQGSDSNGLGWMLAVLRGMLILMWVLVPFYVIYLIISKEARKRLLRDILLMLPILIMLYLLSNGMNERKEEEDSGNMFGNQAFPEQEFQPREPVTLPEFQPPAPWVTTLTSLVLAVATVALVSFAVFIIWRRRHKKEDAPLRKIEMEAQEAIDSLDAGGDLREVIQRCYLQMVVAMREYRMIQRNQDVTPHEFEQVLARQGLPFEPVHELTDLFERVRYGGYQPGRPEEMVAKSSLSAIISACKRISTRIKP